jgi:hypothetical protein
MVKNDIHVCSPVFSQGSGKTARLASKNCCDTNSIAMKYSSGSAMNVWGYQQRMGRLVVVCGHFGDLSSKLLQNWLNAQKSGERELTAAALLPTLAPVSNLVATTIW